MERLTIPDVRVDEHTTRRSVIDVLAVQEHAMEIYHQLKIYEDIAELCGGFARLRELAEADKDGRVVVMPCKFGDKLYRVFGEEIQEFTVSNIKYMGLQHRWSVDTTPFILYAENLIGTELFLAREEAARAIQEMEGKKDD